MIELLVAEVNAVEIENGSSHEPNLLLVQAGKSTISESYPQIQNIPLKAPLSFFSVAL